MSKIVSDPRLLPVYQLFSRPGIQKLQILSPDLSSPRAREGLGCFDVGTRKSAAFRLADGSERSGLTL